MAPSHMGGLETVVAELLLAAQTQLHSAARSRTEECFAERKTPVVLTCLALLEPSAPLPAAFAPLADQGINVLRIPARHRAYVEQYRLLRLALIDAQPQLIHSHGYHADVLATLLARSVRVPHVSTLHGFVGGTRKGRIYTWLQLTSLRRAAAVIAVSETVAVKTRARGVPSNRVHVIPNAAPGHEPVSREEARDAIGVKTDAVRLLGWIGRMSDEKDPLAFVALLRLLHDHQSPATGVMIGDGPLMAQVRSVGAELVSSGHLVLTGAKPDAGRLLRAFDALLLTSSTEGTPMVALEAMRSGVPVVSTAVGGVPAMLEPDCGVLVPHGDTAVMSHAVISLLGDAERCERITSNAHARVLERYSRDAWWKAHEKLYTSIVSATNKPSAD